MRNRVGAFCFVIAAAGAAAMPKAAFAQADPGFDDTVLEMTPATVDRFAKALALEESSRKSIAAKASAPVPKATKTKDEYEACQMELMMSPEFQQLMQRVTAAVSGGGKDPAATQRAVEDMQGKVDAAMEKSCGPDPNKTYSKPDVGSQLRTAQSEAARTNGFTDRQYAVIKERVAPLCLSDPAPADPDGLKIRGDGRVFFVYTASEVEVLRPRCEALMKLIVPKKQ